MQISKGICCWFCIQQACCHNARAFAVWYYSIDSTAAWRYPRKETCRSFHQMERPIYQRALLQGQQKVTFGTKRNCHRPAGYPKLDIFIINPLFGTRKVAQGWVYSAQTCALALLFTIYSRPAEESRDQGFYDFIYRFYH